MIILSILLLLRLLTITISISVSLILVLILISIPIPTPMPIPIRLRGCYSKKEGTTTGREGGCCWSNRKGRRYNKREEEGG